MATRSTLHRHAGVLVRTAHLGGVVGVLGAALYDAPVGGWAELLVGSGMVLVADEFWRFGLAWLRYLQAWVLLAKIGLFAVFAAADAPLAGLWVAFLLGSVISHAPGPLRHFAILGEPGPCARPRRRANPDGPTPSFVPHLRRTP